MHAHVFSTVAQTVLLFVATVDEMFSYFMYFLVLLAIIGLIRALGKKPEITDHWYHLFEEGQFSSQEFYKTIVDALTEKNIPHVYFAKTTKSEGGLFADDREYIVASRSSIEYILCAAPFGTSFFVSWRQGQTRDFGQRLLAGIPGIGTALEQLMYKPTYYQDDTRIMFQDTIHTTVLKIVDAMALAKGIRGPVELERKPIVSKRY